MEIAQNKLNDLKHNESSAGNACVCCDQTTSSKSSMGVSAEGESVPNGCIKDLTQVKEIKNDKQKVPCGNCCKSTNLCTESLVKESNCKDSFKEQDVSHLSSALSTVKVDEFEEDQCASDSVKNQIKSAFVDEEHGIKYEVYESELQMPDIIRLITKDLSEPYSIYTYRYFIHNWPKLCYLAYDEGKCVGSIVCKLDLNKKMVRRGYIAMLAVDKDYRRRKIGSNLVLQAIRAMIADDCDEVVLETEITNKAALHLYENLGFVRDKRLFRYYLNGVDALRLKLWLS